MALIDDDKYVCEDCGGTNIEQRCWVDPNTNEVVCECSGDRDDNWCKDCNDNVYFVLRSNDLTRNEYTPNNIKENE
jgi:hypothetical protein